MCSDAHSITLKIGAEIFSFEFMNSLLTRSVYQVNKWLIYLSTNLCG